MHNLKARLRVSAVHLAISFGLAALAALLVFGLWYPYPYYEISGGRELFLLVIAVDVVMGPLITLVIFNRAKSRRHLAMDFAVIGLLQLATLSYGLWMVFVARPVHLVFEFHRMAVVHAVDIDPAQLIQAPAGLQALPLTGPTLLSLRTFRNPDEQNHSIFQALTEGVAQAAQPGLWQPYNAAYADILKESRPVTQLKARFPDQAAEIDSVVARSGLQANNLSYLPLLARKNAWTVVIDTATAQTVGFLPIDSF